MTSEKSVEASFTGRSANVEFLNPRFPVMPLVSELESEAAASVLSQQEWAGEWRLGNAITDTAQQQQVLEGLCALQAAGLAYDPLTQERLGPVQLREDGTLLLAASIGRRQLLLQLVSYHAAYCLHWEPTTGFILSSLQRFADRVQRRCGVSARVKLQLRPWADSEVSAEGTVVDVSSGGLAFTVERASHLPVKGQRLRHCMVSWKGGSDLSLDVEVAQLSCHGPRLRVGVRLIDAPAEWRDLVEDLQFSESFRGDVPADQVWSAYVASGYLNISGRESANFEEERPAFRRAQELLAKAPDVGALFSGGRRGQPEAHIHHLQAWPGSWINIHLCRLAKGRTLRTSDDAILLHLYEHCYGFAVADPQTRWFVTYTHAQDTAYSHRLHCEFARGLSGGAGCVIPFEPIEVHGSAEMSGDEQGIADAAPAELELLRRILGRQLPLSYLKAVALAEDDLGIASMTQAWEGSGLSRGREVLVARRAGRVVAAAVLDYSSRGMHVYGLLDKVRLIEVDPVGRGDFDRLLAAAHRRYAARGQRKFVYFRELQAPLVAPGLAPASLGRAHINVVSRDQFGSFLEHVFLLHSRTMNHSRLDGRSYTVASPRVSMVRNLGGKARIEGPSESRV
jgi:hypothetical protein